LLISDYEVMTLAPSAPEVLVDTSSVKLSTQTVKGMNQWEIESLRTSVANINNNIIVSSRTIVEISKDLYTIKNNVGKGNWNALLASGALACTPKKAKDLVSAFENWLSKGQYEETFVAQASARTLAAMANATEAERQKVYKLFLNAGANENITEARVRAALKGGSRKKKVDAKTVDEKVAKLQESNASLMKTNKALREENARLRKLVGEAAAAV